MTDTLQHRLARPCLALAAVAMASLPGLAMSMTSAKAGGRPLSATLSGAVEVPRGDPDGAGKFTLRVNSGKGEACYTLTVSKIDPANGAHIHKGGVGEAGPMVAPLTAPAKGSSKGCVTVAKDLAKDLIQNPQAYYVNVHNAAFPAGAVRGQLSK